ncbi:MAG: nitrate- and nitrite sensing domain-containing protein [Magnetococcales bacterium]|nr:nitrate- and nitrite sensing domain-containing protein [Magnetococcales bacterium]
MEKLRFRFGLMLLFPLAGLIWFSVQGVVAKYDILERMAALAELAELAVESSALVHETQKERGYTAGFLGSSGEQFRSELSSQRQRTNRNLLTFQKKIKDFDVEKVGAMEGIGADFQGALAHALSYLDAMAAFRLQVDQQKISVQEAITHYSEMNAAFLEMIGVLSRLTTNPQMMSLIAGYEYFLLSKERAGIERALITGTLAQDQFAPGNLHQFHTLVAEQETYTRVFLSFMTAKQSAFYHNMLSHEVVSRVGRLRQIILAKGERGSFGIDANDWFYAITKKIDLLKEVENRLSEEIQYQGGVLELDAEWAFRGYLVLNLLVVLLAAQMVRLVHEYIGRLRGAERGLSLHRDHLQELVSARTGELSTANARLQEALRVAESANVAKGQFVATMSHEIRTPLNVVLGMLELLRDAKLDREAREHVKLASSSGENLLSLVNNILDYSKIEAGQFIFDQVDFDLRELMEETALALSPLAQAKGIELTVFYPSELPARVMGDANRLRQVFTNLIANAVKFTPAGGLVEFHGGPVGRSDKGIEFLFEVRDTGIGVDEALREKIFDRFTQADSSTTRLYGGSGLGLAICKHLVAGMDGEIGVEANAFADSGSTFHFTIELGEQPHQPRLAEPSGLEGMRALVVAGEGMQLSRIRNILDAWGVRCGHVTAISKAVELLRNSAVAKHPFDLVIINDRPDDHHRRDLPLLETANTPSAFILLTDHLDSGFDQTSFLPGPALCLKKTFTTEQLQNTIRWLMKTPLDPGSSVTLLPREPERTFRSDVRILLVDDHEANLAVTRGMLAKLGIASGNIVSTTQGEEAFAACREEAFDLVFMDCQMPIMDGYQATRAIRQWALEEGLPRIPIIAFTADITGENQQSAREAGMDDLLEKPVALDALREKLSRFIPLADSPQPATSEISSEATLPKPALAQVTAALEAIGLTQEDMVEVAGLLTTQMEELLGNLVRDLKRRNPGSARATSHVLKGSIVGVIFPDLRIPLQKLHKQICEGQWQAATGELEGVREAFSALQEVLGELSKGGSG